MDGAIIRHNKTLLQSSYPWSRRFATGMSYCGEVAHWGANTFSPTVVSNDPAKSWPVLLPTPRAVLKGRSGLPRGLPKLALALHLLGFHKGPDLLLLTLIRLAREAENQ